MKKFILLAIFLSACASSPKQEVSLDDCAKEAALVKVINPTTSVLSDATLTRQVMSICGVDENIAKSAIKQAKKSRTNHKL